MYIKSDGFASSFQVQRQHNMQALIPNLIKTKGHNIPVKLFSMKSNFFSVKILLIGAWSNIKDNKNHDDVVRDYWKTFYIRLDTIYIYDVYYKGKNLDFKK